MHRHFAAGSMARRANARSASTKSVVLIAAALAFSSVAWAADAAKSAKPAAAKRARKALAEPALPPALPEQIAAADRVYYGTYECEFNQEVHIERSPQQAAYIRLTSGKTTWLMKPVLSTTGAVRLEDVKGETLMVQISTKSMLLNVKTARRIVDDCISPRQRELIAEAKATKAAESGPATDKANGSTETAASAPEGPSAASEPATVTSPPPRAAASAASSATGR